MSAIIYAALFFAVMATTGVVCRKAGEKFGRAQGQREGFSGGWAMAHRRIAQTLNVSPASLHCSLLQLEILQAHNARESKPAAPTAQLTTDKQ